MPDRKQEELLKKGAKAWNDSFTVLVRDGRPDLSEARLSECVLTGAFLRDADLTNADLSYATLEKGTTLWKADLSGAKLDSTKLTGANLNEVNFTGAHFFDTRLREAELKGAILGDIRGSLLSEQLGGSDLTGATIPEPLTSRFESLTTVKDISESARKLFIAMLAACLYSWLTIATTTDVNLITNRASLPLPIIQTSIPILGFYVVAPVILLCIYFYFHFYLQKLWEELASLPAVFPDGRPLHAKVDPWLLNDLVRAHLPMLTVNRPFLSYLQLWISILLAWWAVPITLVLFWGRYLRRHEELGTAFHVVLLVLSLTAALCLYRLAVATLRGAERDPFGLRNLLRGSRSSQTAITFSLAIGLLFWLLSIGAIWGVRSRKSILGFTPASERQVVDSAEGPSTWIPRGMALIGYPPFANLNAQDVSQRTSTNADKNEHESTPSVIAAQLTGADLRYASAERAFLADADMSYADLRHADFFRAYLRGAHLNNADIRGANLTDGT